MGIIKFNKIARFMDVDDTTNIRTIFGKNKFKDIKKTITIIENDPTTYNYPELNGIADVIRMYSYTFMCAESDESPEGLACYDQDYLDTRWYAIACDNMDSNDCLCTDSYGGIVAGSEGTFVSTGLSNCACSY